ncbi:MAG: acyltransferase family protein, partial [Halioglobus sp.]|nr:acyltransferase family protein [Halioglobus sp.]
VFSLANVHFWLQAGYFDAAAESKPLLHTWSLSVEEQFYLFWPALLLLLGNRKRRVVVTLLLLAVSLVSAVLLRYDYPEAVFYLLPFRLHQLMAGALMAILSLRLLGMPGSLVAAFGLMGFLVLTVVFGSDYSPAVGAVWVTGFGALLVLGRESPFVVTLMGSRPMQWVGQRSYALYLVHWPLVVLYKFAFGFELHTGDAAILCALSLLLAVLLHELVEKPFRKRGEDTTWAQRLALPASFVMLIAAVGLATVLWQLDGLSHRSAQQIQRVMDSIGDEKRLRNRWIRYGQCNLHKNHEIADYDVQQCATPASDRDNVLVVGDSIAADTYVMLSTAWPEIHFLQATAGACTALLRLTEPGQQYSVCENLNKLRFEEIAAQDVDLVVLASTWSINRIPRLVETVNYLRSKGKRVLVIGPRATFRASLPLLLSQQATLERANEVLRERVLKKDALLASMRDALPDVEIIDIGRLQCRPHCDVIEAGQLLYYDRMHLTVLGSQRMGTRLRESFDLLTYLRSPQARGGTK